MNSNQTSTLSKVDMKVGLRNDFLSLEPGEIIKGGNILLLGSSRVISYPVVIGNPVFITDDTIYRSSNAQEGILVISDIVVELGDTQEIIEYREKPRILLHVGGVVQFIMQPTTYLKGKTQIELEWEFTTSPVPLRATLRVG